MLRSAASIAAIALVTAGGASAEVVARGVQDGLLALDAKGTPSVAWVHNSTLFVATRAPTGKWTRKATATVPPGSSAVAFEIGAAGPVALVQSGDDRTIELVRPRSIGWETIRDRQGGRALPARLAGPGARPPRAADDQLHALERPDPEEPPARLAGRCQGAHLDPADHAGGVPEEPRAAAFRAGPLRRRHARGRVVWLPRRRGHDRVVPVEEDVDRPRVGRRNWRLPDRPGLRGPQPERDHARRLDRVDAHVRHSRRHP